MGQDSRCASPPHVCTSMSHLASWSRCARGQGEHSSPQLVLAIPFPAICGTKCYCQYPTLCCSGLLLGGSLARDDNENDIFVPSPDAVGQQYPEKTKRCAEAPSSGTGNSCMFGMGSGSLLCGYVIEAQHQLAAFFRRCIPGPDDKGFGSGTGEVAPLQQSVAATR